MTNEMKLLQELCKALGFQIETTIDRKERKETAITAEWYNKGPGQLRQYRRLKSDEPHGMLDIDKDGMYTSYLIEPVISYKLTRIEEGNNND